MTETHKEVTTQEPQPLGFRVKRLVSGFRRRLSLPDTVTDEEILEGTKGTFSLACAEIEIAKEDFSKAIIPVLDKIAKDINKAFARIG